MSEKAEIVERVAKLEARLEMLNRVQGDHGIALISLDTKIDKLISQVRDIKWVLALIAVGQIPNLPLNKISELLSQSMILVGL